MKSTPIPVKGCIVRRKFMGDSIGEVVGIKAIEIKNVIVNVRWSNGKQESISVDALHSGFKIGMDVQDMPRSRTRKSLGEGTVLEIRTIGERDQVLVEFPESGQRIWVPYQNLRYIRGTRYRFDSAMVGGNGEAERFRLRTLAYGLQIWNENTGELSKLDIDPLPHQVHLVHHILKSGNLNWLIADDVGLGKTIEVGMLLSALRQRKNFRRVLLITPAGLVKQWKEELHYKFGLSDYRIYGQDFQINEIRDWKHYDHVIGSMDVFKAGKHIDCLLKAETWDLVIFDESHRLSRTQYGLNYRLSDRYRLAANLRRKTDSILLLSATPHQGKQDKFQALLELIRPEWRREISKINYKPEILREMVIRNNKADVIDVHGEFIFKGKITKKVSVPLGREERDFDALLRKYISEGYAAGQVSRESSGRAIGFVMTVYRKLAASSIAAIENALSRRLAKLKNVGLDKSSDTWQIIECEDRYVGEWEEQLSLKSHQEFFEGEIKLLESVIDKAKSLLMIDQKIRVFVDDIVISVLAQNSNEKILVFTEYRGTQDYVASALRTRFGSNSVQLIHGGMSHLERSDAISAFETTGQFLVSTEAGGEGINLQRHCHVMVNFDLPWNPMRLVQRVGRLYRYGQNHPVVVFNIESPQTLDAEIVGMMYDRIQQVVKDLSILGGEFREGLEDEIVGEFAELVDITHILEASSGNSIARTLSDIDKALSDAKDATQKQREIFQFFAGYDPNETKNELRLTGLHLKSFILGMIKQVGINVIATRFEGEVLMLRFPDEVREALGMGQKQTSGITFSRDVAARQPNIEMMDFDSPLLNYFVTTAKAYAFGGRAAKIQNIDGRALFTAMLRWQNDQGIRMREEYMVALVMEDGGVKANPFEILEWLEFSAKDGDFELPNQPDAKEMRNKANICFESRLSEISNVDLHPDCSQLITAGYLGSYSSNTVF